MQIFNEGDRARVVSNGPQWYHRYDIGEEVKVLRILALVINEKGLPQHVELEQLEKIEPKDN